MMDCVLPLHLEPSCGDGPLLMHCSTLCFDVLRSGQLRPAEPSKAPAKPAVSRSLAKSILAHKSTSAACRLSPARPSSYSHPIAYHRRLALNQQKGLPRHLLSNVNSILRLLCLDHSTLRLCSLPRARSSWHYCRNAWTLFRRRGPCLGSTEPH